MILDVVFTHTAEANKLGPTLCFRGIDNAIFSMLAEDKRHYRDYTGMGNTCNANHAASHVAVDFVLPPAPYGTRWHLAVDSARAAPYDMYAEGDEALVEPARLYRVSPTSSVILVARRQHITNTEDHAR